MIPKDRFVNSIGRPCAVLPLTVTNDLGNGDDGVRGCGEDTLSGVDGLASGEEERGASNVAEAIKGGLCFPLEAGVGGGIKTMCFVIYDEESSALCLRS